MPLAIPWPADDRAWLRAVRWIWVGWCEGPVVSGRYGGAVVEALEPW